MKSNIIVGALVLFIFHQCSNSKDSKTSSSLEVFADRIELSDMADHFMDLSQHRGKTIIINVWATWCKPCIEEMPSLEAMQDQLSSDKYVLLLASNEPLEKIRRFKQRYKFDFNYVHLKTSPESLGVYSLPTTFILNGEGKLIITETGSKDWSTETSIQEITHLPEL